MDTIGLASWGDPGPGHWLTIYVKPYGPEAHTFIEFAPGLTPPAHRYWGTSATNPGGGPGWIPKALSPPAISPASSNATRQDSDPPEDSVEVYALLEGHASRASVALVGGNSLQIKRESKHDGCTETFSNIHVRPRSKPGSTGYFGAALTDGTCQCVDTLTSGNNIVDEQNAAACDIQIAH